MTLEEARKIGLNDKWTEILIEGKRIKKNPYNVFSEVVMATDEFFQWHSGGNDIHFINFVNSLIGYPTRQREIPFDGKMVSIYHTSKEYLEKEIDKEISDKKFQLYLKTCETVEDYYRRYVDDWEKAWGLVKMSSGVLCTDVISTAYIGGPRSWILPNGKIGGYKCLESLNNCESIVDDLIAFANAFHSIELWVTVCDCGKSIITFHIHNGEVSLEEPHSYNLVEKGKSQKNKLKKFSSNKRRLTDWLIYKFFKWLPKSWLDNLILSRREFWAGMHREEQFFDELELREIIQYWTES